MVQRILAKRLFQPFCQMIALILINGHYHFFKTFTIYQGRLKNVCIPALNCYSCPLALYSCPIGSIQHFLLIGSFPLYISSCILILGITFGRVSCGLLCPFGYLQDFIYKLGKIRMEIPHFLLYSKYLVLAILVIIIPVYFVYPAFCKICPVGILEAGFPLALFEKNVSERLFDFQTGNFIGWMFFIKTVLLLVILLAAANMKRPFCRILCPLGALLGLFNKFSMITIKVDQQSCNDCGLCKRLCPMDIDISKNSDSAECVRCMKCTACENVNISLRLFPLSVPKYCKKKTSEAVKFQGDYL